MAINLTATNAEVIEEINRKDIFTDGTGLGTAAVTTSPYSCAKWVGNNPAIKSLFTGLIVWHKIGVAGNGSYGTSLNINNLGEHPVVANVNTMVSTRYAVGCIIPLIYDADGTGSLYLNSASATTVTGVWKIADYDANTTITYGTLAYYFRPYTAAALYRYKLCAMTKDNKLLPLITTNNTAAATNLTPTATAFRPDKIYWYNTTTTINANAVIGANTLMSNGYNATNMAICNFNANLPTYRYIYLCGTYDTTTGLFTLNGGGTEGSTAYYTFVPDNTSNITLSSYFTAGKDYILIGASYSTANYMHLREDNLLFHFDGTNLVPYDTYRVNSLGTAATKNTGTSSGNIPVLDSNGKLADSVIPAVAITDTFTASSQAAMLALTAEKGDVCIRTDLNKSFILSTNSPSTLADWKELLTPTDAVTSVNGKTGAVTLTASDVSALPSSTVIPTKTSQLTNDSAFVTASAVPTKTSDLTNDSGYITSSDIPAIPTTLAELDGDSTHRLVTDTEKSTWNAKQNAITSSNKLLSDLVDDTNQTNKFVTSTEKTTWNNKQNAITDGSATIASVSSDVVTLKTGVSQSDGSISNSTGNDITLAKVAKTGSYNDLSNKPTIPNAPGTLNTNNNQELTVQSSESLSGSINLHRVAKTGNASKVNDLQILDQTYAYAGSITTTVGCVGAIVNTGLTEQEIFNLAPTSSMYGKLYLASDTNKYWRRKDTQTGAGSTHWRNDTTAVNNSLALSNQLTTEDAIYIRVNLNNKYYSKLVKFFVAVGYDNISGSTSITAFCRQQNQFEITSCSYNGNNLIGIYQPTANTDIYVFKFAKFKSSYGADANYNVSPLIYYNQYSGTPTIEFIGVNHADYNAVRAYGYISVPAYGIKGTNIQDNLIPISNNAYDLGTSSIKWRNLNLAGTVNTVNVTASGTVTAATIKTTGGTSSQFLKADGSVDSKSYITAADIPTIPTVNNGTLTIKKNGTSVATFTANQAGNSEADITVPTKTSDLTNDSGFITDAGVTSVSLASGTNNGTLKLTVNGSSTDNIAVKGLGTAAYKADSYFGTATAVSAAQSTADTAKSIAEGRAKAVSFATVAAMKTALAAASATEYKVGDNLFIVATDVPDYWVSKVNATQSGDYGYYEVSELETQKVDLTDYQTKTDNSLATTAKTVVGAINELNSGKADVSDIPDVSDMVTKSGNQTISGTKTFDSTDTYISGFGVSKTNNLGNSGYYAFVRGNSSNPLFGLRYGSTNYYLQVSASGLQLGPTSAVATTWASNGDVTMQGTNRPKWKTSNLALQSEIPTVDGFVSDSSHNAVSNAAITGYVDENKSTIHEASTSTAIYDATYDAYICGVDAETFYEGKHSIFVVVFSAGAEPDLTKPIYFLNTLDNSMVARIVTPTTLFSQGTPISILAKQCYYAYPFGGSASAVLSFTGTTTQVLRDDWDIIVDTPNLSNLPEASTSTAGVVTTGEQTFSGNKYFSNNIYSYGSDGLVAGLATNTKYKSGEINNRGFALTLPLKQGTLATLDDIPPNAGVPELTDATIRIYDLDYGIYRWNYNGQKYVNPYGQSGTSTQAVGTASTNNFLVYVYNGFQMVFGGACKSYIIFASNTSTNPSLATPYLYYGDCSLLANATMGSCNYGQFNPVTANDTSATAGTLTSINIGGTNYAVGGGGSSSAGVYVSSYINPAATSLVSISNVSLQSGQTLKVGDLVIGKKGTSASSAVSGTLVISKVTSIISSYYNCSIEYDSTALTTSSVTSGSTALVTSGGVYTAIQNAITTALNNSY